VLRLNEEINGDETIIWTGKPRKPTYLLPGFGGIPFALFFLLIGYLINTISPKELFFSLFVGAWAVGLIVVPPIWKAATYRHVEYSITNKRLIIKSGINSVWSTDLGSIKQTIVKEGLADRLFRTGTIYPITPQYPYAPEKRAYYRYGSGAGAAAMQVKRHVYNLADNKYEDVTQYELYMKSITHPHLDGIVKPQEVQRILLDATHEQVK
jgi:hypothetical protein